MRVDHTSESCSPHLPPLQVKALQSQLDTVQGEAAQLRSAKSQVELQLSEQQLSEQEEAERVQTKLSSTQTQVRAHHNLHCPHSHPHAHPPSTTCVASLICGGDPQPEGGGAEDRGPCQGG